MSGLRLVEFFEGETGRLSMTRLIVLLTWPAATAVVLSDGDQLANYLGIYVGGYAAGKVSDAFMAPKQSKASDMDSGSVSADIHVTASQPLATKSKSVGRGKKRAF